MAKVGELLFLVKKKGSIYFLMANETNGQLNFVSLFFFFCLSLHSKLSSKPQCCLWNKRKARALFDLFVSKNAKKKKTNGTSSSNQLRRSKKLVFPLCLCKSCSQCKTKILLFCFCSNKKKLKFLRLICFKMWRFGQLNCWCR